MNPNSFTLFGIFVKLFLLVCLTGVRETGHAAVDPQRPSALITIKGGNEPHGVFIFTNSSQNKKVPEQNGTVYLTVDRMFGNIGIHNNIFTILLFLPIFSYNFCKIVLLFVFLIKHLL